MMEPYSVIAKVYDLFLDDFNYLRLSEYIKKTLKVYNLKGTVVDAGCGTGTMLRLLQDISNDSIGIDISAQMLSFARRKNLKSFLVMQDITKLELASSVSLIYSSLDVINHLSTIREVDKFFRRVSLFLEGGGVFIFDFNLPYKHNSILANNCFTYEKHKYLLIWNSYLHKDRVNICLDLFTQADNGLYMRESEQFSEYTYYLNDILKLLDEEFEILEVIDGDKYTPLSERSERALVSVKKKV